MTAPNVTPDEAAHLEGRVFIAGNGSVYACMKANMKSLWLWRWTPGIKEFVSESPWDQSMEPQEWLTPGQAIHYGIVDRTPVPDLASQLDSLTAAKRVSEEREAILTKERDYAASLVKERDANDDEIRKALIQAGITDHYWFDPESGPDSDRTIDMVDALIAERSALAERLRVAEEERAELRVAYATAYAGAKLYTDDGELQDSSAHPFIDFKRDPWGEIKVKLASRAALAAQPAGQGYTTGGTGVRGEADRFLCRGTGFKLHFNQAGNCTTFVPYAKELEGRWVALVPAEDNMHMQAQPKPVAVVLPAESYFDQPEGRIRYYPANETDAALRAAGCVVEGQPAEPSTGWGSPGPTP